MPYDLPPNLPERIKEKAISLQYLGVDNAAWYRDDALTILKHIEKSSVAVLGGDVLSLQEGRLKHNCDNWYASPQPGEEWHKFAARSLEETRQYISSYPDRNNHSIAYVLVFGEKNIHG